jgi:hypothetical protein
LQKQFIVGAALMALGLGAVGTAHAQYVSLYPHVYRPGVPPQQIVAAVRAAGLQPVSPLMRRGPNYVVIATDRTGGQVRVVVNGYNGMIVRVRPMLAMRPAPYGPVAMSPYAPRVAAVPPEAIDAPPPAAYGGVAPPRGPTESLAPMPPNSVPNPHVANVPNPPNSVAPHTLASQPAHTLAAEPPRTPLPRPRPAVASNEAPAATAATPATSAAPPSVKPVGEGSWPVPGKPEGKSEPQTPGDLKMVPVTPLD